MSTREFQTAMDAIKEVLLDQQCTPSRYVHGYDTGSGPGIDRQFWIAPPILTDEGAGHIHNRAYQAHQVLLHIARLPRKLGAAVDVPDKLTQWQNDIVEALLEDATVIDDEFYVRGIEPEWMPNEGADGTESPTDGFFDVVFDLEVHSVRVFT